MLGPYTSLSALLEATKGDFFQLEVGDRFTHSDWTDFREITIGRTIKSDEYSNNPVMRLVASVMSLPDFDPKIYVHAYSPGEAPPEISRLFAKPDAPSVFIDNLKTATAKGFPPTKIRIYLVGPSDKFFEQIHNSMWNAWWLKKNASDEKKIQVHQVLNAEARKLYAKEKAVLGWIQLRTATRKVPMGNRSRFFTFPRDGAAVHASLGVSDRPIAPTAGDKKILRQTPKDRAKQQGEMLKAWLKVYHHELWRYFQSFALTAKSSVQAQIEDALQDARVRAAFMKAKGWGEPQPYKVPREKYDPKKPHKSMLHPGAKGVKGGVAGMVSFAKVANRSKVIPSIRSESGKKQDTVTADPRYRAWLQSDGSLKKPELKPIDQQDMALMPVDSVAPLIETDQYKVIFGIYYDHELLSPGLNSQLWWYSSKNLFINAAYRYSLMTGDRPNVAFIVYEKAGPRAGIQISAHELKQRSDQSARNILVKVNQLVESFWRSSARGQQIFPVLINKWLGVPADKLVYPESPWNPTKDVPEGVPADAWFRYVKWLRRNARDRLGLNLKASMPVEFIDPKTGKMKKLQYSRQNVKRDYALTQTQRHTGERNEKGEPIEPWGVYLIQYLLAHGPSDSPGGPTFMVPINVLRSQKGDIPPRRGLTKVDKPMLQKLLREHWAKFRFATEVDKWHFIKASPTLPFPYARLIRPHALSVEAAKKANARLPHHIQRTQTGYIFDGIEYDAYVMLVAMPPSVAERMSLIAKHGTARQLITDPKIVYRLRRGQRGKIYGSMQRLGLTSTQLQMQTLTSPYEKEKLAGFDPIERGVIPKETEIPAGQYMSEIGERWSPVIATTLNDVGNTVSRIVTAYEHANSREQREELYERYVNELEKSTGEVETYVRQMMSAMARVPAIPGTRGEDIARNVDLFLQYATRTTRQGQEYRVPELIKKVGLTKYQAPVGSTNFRNVFLSIKAPSEDVAKLLILYRLLRRSAHNKQFGKAMLAKSLHGKFKIFPDINARLLAQWAKARFIVIPHRGPKVRRIPERKIRYAKDYVVQRAAHMGDHRFARMLRVE